MASSPSRAKPPPLPAHLSRATATAPAESAAAALASPEVATAPAAANTGPPAGASATAPKKRLGEILVDAGVVTDKDVARALAVQRMGGGRLGSILVKLRLCTEAQIREALQEQRGVEIVQLEEFKPDQAALSALPRELILRYEVIPLQATAETIHIAMLDPFNLTAVDDIQFATGKKVIVVSCTESDFARFVNEHLKTQSLMQEILDGGEFYERAVHHVDGERHDEEEQPVHDLKIAGEQAPIITMCNFLLVESIVRKASDIHIEPYETYFRIRLRIDGVLQTLLTPPQRLHGAMITRMKIMGQMDIAKRREPQDGHIAITYENETCHYRVSTLPTVYGEKCVVRLLKKDAALQAVDTLGFVERDLDRFKKAIAMPQGIVLVTGPTGSGKTTSLHAGLSEINQPGVNIVTLEDPVEATLPGINHVQINEAAGLSFSSGLRSILRQDPDVVFVGEMRDTEVAAIAVKAALTGHLVMSTLHTNSAAESLLRLADMGVAPYLLANALVMVVAQRLVRQVCPGCAKPYAPSAAEIDEFRLEPAALESATPRRGAGCPNCFDTGYRGRVAVYEVLSVTNAIRTLIRRQAPVEEIIEAARADGMTLLYAAGIARALAGATSFDEVRRTLSEAQ